MGEHNKRADGRENKARFRAAMNMAAPLGGGRGRGWWTQNQADSQPSPAPSLSRRGTRGHFHRQVESRKVMESVLGMTLVARRVLCLAALGALVLTLAPSSRAENPDAEPAALGKQRARLYLQATRAPLASLESEVNHLAMLSETCRIEHGAQACGLSDKPLESSKLEDRYAYYVKQPVEAHPKAQGVKIQRRNWEGFSKAATSDK